MVTKKKVGVVGGVPAGKRLFQYLIRRGVREGIKIIHYKGASRLLHSERVSEDCLQSAFFLKIRPVFQVSQPGQL